MNDKQKNVCVLIYFEIIRSSTKVIVKYSIIVIIYNLVETQKTDRKTRKHQSYIKHIAKKVGQLEEEDKSN